MSDLQRRLQQWMEQTITMDAVERKTEELAAMFETRNAALREFNRAYPTISPASELALEDNFAVGFVLQGRTTQGALLVPRPDFAAVVLEAPCGSTLLGVWTPPTSWKFQHLEH